MAVEVSGGNDEEKVLMGSSDELKGKLCFVLFFVFLYFFFFGTGGSIK